MTEHEKNGFLKRLMFVWPIILVVASAIAFWATTGKALSDNDKWHEKNETKLDSHETRISKIEGKLDTMITLQTEILRYVRKER